MSLSRALVNRVEKLEKWERDQAEAIARLSDEELLAFIERDFEEQGCFTEEERFASIVRYVGEKMARQLMPDFERQKHAAVHEGDGR